MIPEWKKYTGSDEQIAEMRIGGFITRDINGVESNIRQTNDFVSGDAHKNYLKYEKITHYLICNPHPLADMICQWARTGQPVYYRARHNHDITGECDSLYKPFANPDAMEYSFTSFGEEV